MFNPQASASNDGIIPHGTLARGTFKVRGLKKWPSGGSYIDSEVIVEQGPYAGRHVFESIQDPFCQVNKEEARAFGLRELTRAGEVSGVFTLGQPDTYTKHKDLRSFLEELDGKMVTIRITIKKGTGQYGDRNRFAFLTPNPEAGKAYQDYQRLNGESDSDEQVPGAEVPTQGQSVSHPAGQSNATPAKSPW